jgi:hypothetical protein
MTGEQATAAVVEALNSLGLSYMVVGSFSTNHYGIPRSTRDADFVLELGSSSIIELARQLGSEFKVDPQMSFETFTGTRKYDVQVPEITFKIELFMLSSDPHDQERFQRRVPVKFLGKPAWLPTVEDVIITKLRWALLGNRSKDRDDVRDVIAVHSVEGRIDWDYVHAWCDRHGTRALLDEVRRSIPMI